jgi:hypothetical protein
MNLLKSKHTRITIACLTPSKDQSFSAETATNWIFVGSTEGRPAQHIRPRTFATLRALLAWQFF